MIVAIASIRGPKVDAVKNVLPSIRHFFSEGTAEISYLPFEIDGGVTMPRTIYELLTGARQRVIVPAIIAQEVMKCGRDLSEVIDEVALQHDVRSKQGTWGFLTKDLLTRQESFEIALKAAFAPFYNKEMYHPK